MLPGSLSWYIPNAGPTRVPLRNQLSAVARSVCCYISLARGGHDWLRKPDDFEIMDVASEETIL